MTLPGLDPDGEKNAPVRTRRMWRPLAGVAVYGKKGYICGG